MTTTMQNNPKVYLNDGTARRRRLLGPEGGYFVVVKGEVIKVRPSERGGFEAIPAPAV